MRVARVEPEGDAAPGLVEHDVLPLDGPLAGESPLVEAQALVRRGEPLAARGTEIRLGSTQVVPVGLRLHPHPFDRDELAVDAQQTLDDALRFLVASLAEVLVADDALG